jgi:hypothetical protein
MLSAALSHTQLFPPFVVLSNTPLPPAAHASSYSTNSNSSFSTTIAATFINQ